MKKDYCKPTMNVVKIQHSGIICTSPGGGGGCGKGIGDAEMILITGGAYQGKNDFAKERFCINDGDMLGGGECGFDEALSAACITEYHELIRRLIAQRQDPVEFTARLCDENSGAVIIMNEVGCGIIPLDKGERLWREQVGRCGCVIARYSEQVWRVTCGTAQMIKGDF